MKMKIAVLVDENSIAVPYSDGGIIELYAFAGNNWQCIKAASLEEDEGTNVAEVRARVNAVMAIIGDCKVFMVETMKSLNVGIFDSYGIAVWNHKGVPMEVFDFVKEQEENKIHKIRSCCDKPSCLSTCSPSTIESIQPPSQIIIENIGDGCYKIDLAKTMKSNPSLNSKQILIPFFQNTEFQKLEIICEHVPKWFENEFGSLKLQVKVEESWDGFCHAIVCSN
jgi:Fe-only nitrogenase accessory protein AnfO